MFSFHATKVFHTVEGGGLSIKDENLAKKIERLRDFGLCVGGEDADYIGTNAKLSEFHAAMGICNLEHLSNEIDKRMKCSEKYDMYLKNVEGLKVFPDIEHLERNYAYYPVLVTEKFHLNREELVNKLAEHNILSRKYFYPLTNHMKCFQSIYDSVHLPNAEYVSNNILCLPMYADLDHDEINRICEMILGE